MRPDDAIPDAPVYTATMAEMQNLEELLATANQLAMQYGAVRIDPPPEWTHPPLRMNPKSRFFVRIQTLPEAPFVDPEFLKQANLAKRHPRKRIRRKHSTANGEDSDDPALVTKDTKTANRDRAARAASRSHRLQQYQTQPDGESAAAYSAPTNFPAVRIAPSSLQELPPNSTCVPVTLHFPEGHAFGPKAEEKPPPLLFAMGQKSAAPSFSRVPASRIQPSSSSPGQPEAVREAALRVAEAFSGLAKAGPAPNATAIPPCPFSQRTAREHMANLTAEDQPPLPLPEGLSVHQALPSTLNRRDLDPNRNQSHVAPTGKIQERIMRHDDVNQIYGHASADRNAAEIGQERNSQDICLQQINSAVHTTQEEAKPDQRVNAAIYAWTEKLKSNAEILKAKNNGADGLANDVKVQRQQIIPTSSPASLGNESPALPVTGSGLRRASSLSLNPVVASSVEHSGTLDSPKKTLENAKQTGPSFLCHAEVPVSLEPGKPGKREGISTVNRNLEPFRTRTKWHAPARKLEHQSTASTQRAPMIRPFLRSVLPPARAPFECRQDTRRMEGLVRSSAISATAPNLGRNHVEEGVRHQEIAIADATPCFSMFTPLPPQPKTSALANRTTPSKPDCETKPPSNGKEEDSSPEQPWESDHVHLCERQDGVARVEPLSYAPTQGHEGLENNADKKRPMVKHPGLNQLSTTTGSGAKIIYGLEQRTWEVHRTKEPYSIPGSENHSDQRKPLFSQEVKVNPKQNANWKQMVSRVALPDFHQKANLNRDGTSLMSTCKAEVGLAEQKRLSPAEPMGLPKGKAADSKSPVCGSRGLPREKLDIARNPGREIVEAILAVATSSADLPSVKVQSKILKGIMPSDGIMTHSGSKRPSLIHKSRSRRSDTLPIETNLSRTLQVRLEPAGEERHTAKTQVTTEGKKETKSMQTAHTSNVEVPHCSPIHDASLKQVPSSDQPMFDAIQDTLVRCEHHQDVSREQPLAKPSLLKEQQDLHQTQQEEIAAASEGVVRVAENGTTATRECKAENPVPIIDVEATDLPVPEAKDTSSCGKPQAKRGPKRKFERTCPRFDQDDVGRLTKAIVFPDSGTPVSLADYEKKAYAHHEETKRALNPFTEGGPETSKAEDLIPKIDMHDVDTLEIEFWNAMTGGICGKSITVAYGVDVEAEGAFDSTEMSYVEWYGTGLFGTKANKRKKRRPPKQRGLKTARRPRPSENLMNKAMSTSDGSRAANLHHDADDEMECDIDDTLRSLAARRRMDHIKTTNLNATVSAKRRSTSNIPRSHVGTLNRDGLLRHLPRMPGINHSMYYVGQLFTRFCWHTEDAYLNSVSYLHHGSAEKVWYAVPPRDAPKFEQYAATNVFSPEILEDESAGQALLMNKTTMFDPRRVRRKGVAVFRVVHKPGSFVLTAARAYHAGFNCGFNIAEAVNFANPTWFPVGRQASYFARRTLKPLCVPWEYLLFHEAKAMLDLDRGAIGRTVSKQRLVGNASVVAKELRAIIMDGEKKVRKYAEASNCRVSMLHQVDGLAKNNQVGPEFGHGAGLVCSLCTHTCHFYAEMCGSCDDSFEARCVDHFGEGHRMCSEPGHKTVVVRRHDPVLLLDILGCLEQMAGIKIDPAEQSRRYLGYLRPWQTPLKSSGLRLRLDLKAAASRLPPKVTEEKSVREKSVREKSVRGKTNRDKVRKIRKPRGMFPQAEVKSKHSSFPRVKPLEEDEVISCSGVKREKGTEEGYKFEDVLELTNKIPLLR